MNKASTVANKDSREIEVPAEFFCPIGLVPMVHPVMNKAGLNFATNWLARNSTS